MSKLVSVIVPAFNAESTLAEAISSANQLNNIEVIVVDDGSTDATVSVARRFQPFVTVLTGPNKGVSAARNLGLNAATGEWVIFLDADDVLLPNTLRQRLDTARNSCADVIICDWELEEVRVDGSRSLSINKFAWSAYPDDTELRLAIHWAAVHACMHRRQTVLKTAGFTEGMPLVEDAKFLFDLAYQGAKFAHSDHVGCRYQYSGSSASRSGNSRLPRYIYWNLCYNHIMWEMRDQVTPLRREALAKRYYASALSFFVQSDPLYWEALSKAHKMGFKKGAHSRLTYPLAKLIGLPASRMLTTRAKRIVNGMA